MRSKTKYTKPREITKQAGYNHQEKTQMKQKLVFTMLIIVVVQENTTVPCNRKFLVATLIH